MQISTLKQVQDVAGSQLALMRLCNTSRIMHTSYRNAHHAPVTSPPCIQTSHTPPSKPMSNTLSARHTPMNSNNSYNNMASGKHPYFLYLMRTTVTHGLEPHILVEPQILAPSQLNNSFSIYISSWTTHSFSHKIEQSAANVLAYPWEPMPHRR
jgi:hypothetical protein